MSPACLEVHVQELYRCNSILLGAPAKNVTLPDSPAFSGFDAELIPESKTTLVKSSGFVTTPNAWNDTPAFIAVTVTSSPEFTRNVRIVSFFPW